MMQTVGGHGHDGDDEGSGGVEDEEDAALLEQEIREYDAAVRESEKERDVMEVRTCIFEPTCGLVRGNLTKCTSC
jgi:hypothetical protein